MDIHLPDEVTLMLFIRAVCNTEVSGLSGVIESPNFPRPYPHDRNCTWTIAAPQGNRVSITFSHFEVEDHPEGNCTFDFVEVNVTFS